MSNPTLHTIVRAIAAVFISGTAIGLASTVQASDAEFKVTLSDGVITPQSVVAPADKSFVLTVSNTGQSVAEFESKQLHIEQVVAPGATANLRVHALPKGSYAFVEEFHEDQASARGTIEVQ